MKIKLTYIVMHHIYVYTVQLSTTLLTQKISVTSTLSRVESALHREDATAVVGFLDSKKGSLSAIRNFSGDHH